MPEINLSDQDLGFIQLVLSKVDPTNLIGEAQAIRDKINAYARDRQAVSLAKASEEAKDAIP